MKRVIVDTSTVIKRIDNPDIIDIMIGWLKKKNGGMPEFENPPLPPAKVYADDKAQVLSELAERYNYWKSKGTDEALQYAAGYERLMCVFTAPAEPDKK
jgi:hypothetical protein